MRQVCVCVCGGGMAGLSPVLREVMLSEGDGHPSRPSLDSMLGVPWVKETERVPGSQRRGT